VANLAIWDEVVRSDEVARIDAALRDKLVNVDRAIDSKAMFSSSSFDTST
jgi:hypothetical protein